MKLTPAQVILIFSLQRGGKNQATIANIVGCSQGTVSKVLNKVSTPQKPVHDSTADRYEHFLGDAARDTGNTHNGHPIFSTEDPTFEEAAFWEELEQYEGGLDKGIQT